MCGSKEYSKQATLTDEMKQRAITNNILKMTNVIHSFNSAYRILGSIAILLSSRILYFYLFCC